DGGGSALALKIDLYCLSDLPCLSDLACLSDFSCLSVGGFAGVAAGAPPLSIPSKGSDDSSMLAGPFAARSGRSISCLTGPVFGLEAGWSSGPVLGLAEASLSGPALGFVISAAEGPGFGSVSPVSSDIPNRSSASRRPPGLFGLCGGVAAAAEILPVVPPFLGGGTGGSSEERSTVLPEPADAPVSVTPDFFTEKTSLQLEQRTRTPRSLTFSSATRKRVWQLGHWTTTLAFSQCVSGPDKESAGLNSPLARALTHTGTCGGIRARRFASTQPWSFPDERARAGTSPTRGGGRA